MTTPDFLRNASGDELHPRGVAGGEAGSSVEAGDDAVSECADEGEKLWPPLIGCMKGEIWIDPDYDFTQPTFPEWEAEIERR